MKSNITIRSRKLSYVSSTLVLKNHLLFQLNILSIIIFVLLSIQLLVASCSTPVGKGSRPLRSDLAHRSPLTTLPDAQATLDDQGEWEYDNKINTDEKRTLCTTTGGIVVSRLVLLQSCHSLLSSQSNCVTFGFPLISTTPGHTAIIQINITIIQNENRFTTLLSSTLFFLVVDELCQGSWKVWILQREWQHNAQITKTVTSIPCLTNSFHVLHFREDEKIRCRTGTERIAGLSWWWDILSRRMAADTLRIILVAFICIPTYHVIVTWLYKFTERTLRIVIRLTRFLKRMPCSSLAKSSCNSKQLSYITSSFVFVCLIFNTIFIGGTLGNSVGSYFIYRRDPFALLTGTLRTYQKASCDGEYMTLRCPMGTTISVQLAQYGKTAPSPAICSTNSNTHSELLDIVDGYANVTCHWPTAIQTVVGLCQKKTSCKFQTSPGTFGGDPCPGSRKYVEVAYKCRPSEFRSVIGCDSEVIQLKCNRSSRLAIYSANYGRTEYESVQCPQPKGVQEESCLSSFATENVMQMCHGKRRCALGVNPATFGTPCKPESKMYLKVINTCVPRKVLKEKYQGELEPDEVFEDETEYESGDPVGGVLEQPSIYSPDHSKGWVNPKSTMKPNFPSKSRSSLKYRPQVSSHDGHSLVSSSSIAHSSSTMPRYINQQQSKVEQQGQSNFDVRKPFSPSQKISPKARYNFSENEAEDEDDSLMARNHSHYHPSHNRNAAIVVTTGVGVTSSRNFRNSAGANHSQDDLRLIYLISQGIRAYDFISRNKESLWLYITISIASALLVVIVVILVKIWVQRSAGLRARRATANLTAVSSKPSSSSAGPITSTALSDIDELSVVTDEVTELPSILRRGSPGDELDLQTSSTTHLISNSSNNSGSSASGTVAINNSVKNGVIGVSGSPSMLTGVMGGFNSSVMVTDGASVAPGGEGALLLGGGGGSVVNTSGCGSTFITSGSSTIGRNPHHHLKLHQQHQQQINHPSSTYMTMTTYGMPMTSTSAALPGGPHPTYTFQQQHHQPPGGTNPSSSSNSVVANPSTMTLGRAMSGSTSRQRDSNIHFYYE